MTMAQDWAEVRQWMESNPQQAGIAVQRSRLRLDPLTWATDTAKVKLPTSGSLTFENHPFLVEPYRDTGKELVFLKGAQLEFRVWPSFGTSGRSLRSL